MIPLTLVAVKILNFKNLRRWTAASLKTVKSQYLGNGSTSLHKIWHGEAHCPSELYYAAHTCATFIIFLIKLQKYF